VAFTVEQHPLKELTVAEASLNAVLVGFIKNTHNLGQLLILPSLQGVQIKLEVLLEAVLKRTTTALHLFDMLNKQIFASTVQLILFKRKEALHHL